MQSPRYSLLSLLSILVSATNALQPECPNIRFSNYTPTTLPLPTLDRTLQACGGHIFAGGNDFILHDNGRDPAYLSSTVTFQHYRDENLCFEQVYESGSKIYQTKAMVMKLVRDVHTTPVFNWGRRASDISLAFTDEHNPAGSSVNDATAKARARRLCPERNQITVQSWGQIDFCGYWSSKYVTAGAACVSSRKNFVDIIQLSKVKPTISVTYETTIVNSTEPKQYASISNKRQENSPGNLQLRSIDFPQSDDIHPHIFKREYHIIKNSNWYEFIPGQMNTLDEHNVQKAFWGHFDDTHVIPRNTQPANTFRFKPIGHASGISATCDYESNLGEIASSSSVSLTPDIGYTDFRGRPFWNFTDSTVVAHSKRNLRVRPSFEIRLPIARTITRDTYVVDGDFSCSNIIRNDTFHNDELLTCSIHHAASFGLLTFHVIYNCEIIATRTIELTQFNQTFMVPIAIYNQTMTGHVCSTTGACVALRIGRNFKRDRVYQEMPSNETYVHSPAHHGLGGGGIGGFFGGMWQQVKNFASYLLSIGWIRTILYIIAGIIGLLLVIGIVFLLWRCGACVSCLTCCCRPRKRVRMQGSVAATANNKSPTTIGAIEVLVKQQNDVESS